MSYNKDLIVKSTIKEEEKKESLKRRRKKISVKKQRQQIEEYIKTVLDPFPC